MDRSCAFAVLTVAVLAAACSSGGSGGPENPPPQRITVSGTVVDEAGRPYAGAWISIGPGLARSAADGTFTIPNVAAPYDVAVIAEGDKTITEIHGVTSDAPVLSFVRQDKGTPRAGTVQGRVRDGQGMVTSGTEIFGPNPWSSASPGYLGDYSLTTWWNGDATATLNHRAIAVDPDGEWLRTLAYAVRPVTVTDAATIAGQDFTVAPLAMGRVTGTGVTDRSIFDSRFSLVARFDDGVERTIFEQNWAEQGLSAFDVLVPAFPDGGVRLAYTGWLTNGGKGTASALVVGGQTGVRLELPAAPVATGPVGAHGNGNGVAIGWTMTEWTGTDLVTVTCASGHVFRIAGRMRSAGIENMPSLAVEVPTNTRCDWTPAWASYSIDELVQGPAAIAALPLVRTSQADGGHFYF